MKWDLCFCWSLFFCHTRSGKVLQFSAKANVERVWLDKAGICPPVPIQLRSPYYRLTYPKGAHSFRMELALLLGVPLFKTNGWAQSSPYPVKPFIIRIENCSNKLNAFRWKSNWLLVCGLMCTWLHALSCTSFKHTLKDESINFS